MSTRKHPTGVRRAATAVFGGGLVLALAATAWGHDDPVVDSKCAWGRVADGRGKLVRCITQNEAAWLSLKKTYDVKGLKPKPVEPAEGDGTKKPSTDPPATEDKPKEASEIRISVTKVEVDEGTLPKALDKLRVPKKRYAQCLRDHGGMFRDKGVLHIRFLVRQRGRAEGVSVQKRRSVSEAAGKCIADVVDRRLVGTPSVEMVGATLVIELEKVEAKKP